MILCRSRWWLQQWPTLMSKFHYLLFVFLCCSTLVSEDEATDATPEPDVLRMRIHYFWSSNGFVQIPWGGQPSDIPKNDYFFQFNVYGLDKYRSFAAQRLSYTNLAKAMDKDFLFIISRNDMGQTKGFQINIRTTSNYWDDRFDGKIHLKAPNFEEHVVLTEKKMWSDALNPKLAISYDLQCKPGRCGSMCNEACKICTPKNSDEGHYECDAEGNRLCLPGYSDPSTNCIQESICFDNPCLNGGTCTEMEEGFWCDCPPDFDGFICEDCTKCKNDGICHIDNQNITCECTMHYDGETCEKKVSPCEKFNNPCQNGGTCFDTADGYLCNCAIGYDGIDCKESAGCDNAENACVHGTCVNKLGKFTCSCEPGMEGKLCEADIDECKNNPCHDTEECINTIGSYHCLGYTYECPLTCHNGGECVSEGSNYRCECPSGFVGSNCDMVDKYWEHPSFKNWGLRNMDSHGVLLKPSKLVLIIGLIILTTIWSLILQTMCT